MRRPRMSTGAWIFAGLICAALIAPAGVYAASITRVALTSSNGATPATITPQHQLLTTTIAPNRVIRVVKVSHSGCTSVYTPPAGKAFVLTSVNYTFGSGTAGVENFGGLTNATCSGSWFADQIDTVQAFDTIEHTFPIGVPLPSVGVTNNGAGDITVFVYGYVIDSSSLPSRSAVRGGALKASSPGR